MVSYSAPDLTQHPPRSPRVKLGGYVVLPRIFDKARAHLAGKAGLYKFNNMIDQRLFLFLGVTAEQFLEGAKNAKSDTEMLAWVEGSVQPKRQTWEIEAWTRWFENLTAGDVYRHTLMAREIETHCPERTDIHTFFDRLDMDDYVTFGGKA